MINGGRVLSERALLQLLKLHMFPHFGLYVWQQDLGQVVILKPVKVTFGTFLGCCFAPTFLSVRNSCVFCLV